MKKTTHPILTAAACFAAALCAGIALTACTSDADEPINDGRDRTPLVFTAAVHGMPATTRSNTAASLWTDGDEVAVEMDGVVKKYIVKAAAGATATLSPADAENTHFWPDLDQPVTVRAWRYGKNDGPYTWDKKPDRWYASENQFGNPYGESEYQRSDFLYAPAKSVSYDAAAGKGTGLTFYHQTARVEVRIRKAGLVDDGNKVDYISLGSAPGYYEMLWYGTFDASQINPGNGEYSGLTADETAVLNSTLMKPMPAPPTTSGYACCYEALVIPQNMDGKHLICVAVGNKYYYYKPKPGEANLQGGYTYTYDIIVSEYGTLKVTVGKPITEWDQQVGGSGTAYNEMIDFDNLQPINDDRVYLMTGDRKNKLTPTLNITGGRPTIIVKDLILIDGGIHITGGTPEIRVEGTNNVLTGNGQPPIWLEGDDANVRITGKGIHESRLELYTNITTTECAAIGSKRSLPGDATACGNIEISNLTLRASTKGKGAGTGAVIGTGGGRGSEKCGNITITDACFIAYPYSNAAAIGFGSIEANAINTDMTGAAYEIGDITITNSIIESTIIPGSSFQGQNAESPAHIGGGQVAAATYKVGAIRINTGKSAREFFEKFRRHDGSAPPADEVIIGFPVGAKPTNGTEFDIYWNGKLVGTEIRWDMLPTLQ